MKRILIETLCELCHQSMSDDGEEGWCYDGNTRPKKCPLMEVEDE